MKRFVIPVLLVVNLGLLAMIACTRADDSDPGNVTQLKEPRDAIGEELMIALAQAKNFHHKAKVYIGDGKPELAIAAVRQILTIKFPPGAPEAEDVRHDARAVLAKMLVGQGKLDEAMTVVEEGLVTKTRDSFFVANLYTVKGEIHHARAQQLGDDPAARTERLKAIEELDRSIKINEELLRAKYP